MSTSEPAQPAAPAGPRMPTPEDAMAIFDRATKAAERAESAAARMEAAQGGARQEAETRFPGMPEEVLKGLSEAVSKQVVESLEARYELGNSGSAPASPPGSGAGTDAGSATPGGASATPPAGGPAGGTGNPPPGRRFDNLAHRILGDRPPNG